MGKKKPPTSGVVRLAKLGGMVGRIGLSAAGSAAAGVLTSQKNRLSRRLDAWQRNARRTSAALGDLKGLPMKIGQLLSLNAGFLPPEVAAAFNQLQQDAPPIAFETVVARLENELGDRFARITDLDPTPHAAASIGQVHRATLSDGCNVVFKVQYPGIQSALEADLAAAKTVLLGAMGLVAEMDLSQVWQEIGARLREEVDYRQEVRFIVHMRRLWQGDAGILIPRPIQALSTRRVLCMAFEAGIPPDQACSRRQPRRLRNRWGRNLLRLLLTGLFDHRLLHADPNIANFSFRDDGGIILYDFGCMKRVPRGVSQGYARLTRAVLSGNTNAVPELLERIGVVQIDGQRVPLETVRAYAEVLREPFALSRPYRFTSQDSLYDRLKALAREHWDVIRCAAIPADVVFIDRTIAGHLGNLARLEARDNWRKMLDRALVRSPAAAGQE
jgi:predicted unusual protein kinase regulating ubiquinone biosynthesis (AarF/ABC1/UbiB family)